MEPNARPCPLCGEAVGPGAPDEAPNGLLERHFQRCSKTDGSQAPRREWDEPPRSPFGGGAAPTK